MNHRDGTNYYDILEITPDTPQNEIHKAYQRAKQTYSQDNPALYSMFSKDEAKELLKMIEEAWQVLGNNQLRQTYDDNLSKGRTVERPALVPHAVEASTRQFEQRSTPIETFPTPTPRAPEPQVASVSMAAFGQDTSELTSQKKRESSSGKAVLPPGTGRTPLSTYKVDDVFEAEIAAVNDCDGLFIQKVRQYRNVTIDKLSEATRISRPYLIALETNDYKSLPAAVFVRGFVVQVARNLALDDVRIAASYMKIFKAGGGK